jgi:hypothetical protein
MKSVLALSLLLVSSVMGHTIPRAVPYNELQPSQRALVDATNLIVLLLFPISLSLFPSPIPPSRGIHYINPHKQTVRPIPNAHLGHNRHAESRLPDRRQALRLLGLREA